MADESIKAAKEFWDAEYPKHNSNGWITMANYARKVADDENRDLRERLAELEGPYAPSDVMDLLIEATDHLLYKHDCDGRPKHEEFLAALNKARAYRATKLQEKL